MKYLLWLVIGVAFFYWITRASRRAMRDQQSPPRSAGPASPPRGDARAIEAMLPCAHCGIHIPASEAILTGPGQSYCSQTHRLLHEQH